MKYFNIVYMLIVLFVSQSCVQQRHTKTVTFKVDMTAIEQPENIGVRGNFTSNPWNETVPLTDDNGDGVYEATLSQKTAFNKIQFKFVNNGEDYELKGADNRVIDFEYKPETIIYECIFNNSEVITIIKE